MSEAILAALAQLDHSDDAQWTPDGHPRVAVIQKITGDKSIGIHAIRRAAPDFVRVVDPLGDAVPVENTEATPVETPPLTVKQAQENLVMAQVRFRKAVERRGEARGRTAQAIQRWQKAIGDIRTHTDNAKEYIRSEQARRAGVAAGELPARQASRPGKSYIDRVRFYGRQGDAADFARKQMHHGGASRGAYPASMRGMQLKPPSQV